MLTNRLFRAALLAAGMLLVGACASQPASTPAQRESLIDRKFQQTAKNYRTYRYQGQIVYCRKEKPITSSVPQLQCLTEDQLRAQVEDYVRTRNTSIGTPIRAGAGQGGVGG
jgi:outer membrane biogenesis lipoprotein LolB